MNSSLRAVPLLLLALAGCHRASAGRTSGVANRAGPPATQQEAMRCARERLAELGFSEPAGPASAYHVTAGLPTTGYERSTGGRLQFDARVSVWFHGFDDNGYPILKSRTYGRTRELEFRATSAAASVRTNCPSRIER